MSTNRRKEAKEQFTRVLTDGTTLCSRPGKMDQQVSSEREMLERLTWIFASNGDIFWPIQETAEACMDAHRETYEENEDMVYAEGLAWEEGQHSRAIMESGKLFEELHKHGYDPVELAESYLNRTCDDEETREKLSVDWDWLRFTQLPEGYVDQYTTDKDRS